VTAAIPDLLLRVVRGRVPSLRLERGHWRGDCPWCDEGGELSQSLYVYPDRYHCFACGTHGDAISFLMWDEGLRFMQAVEWLAAMAGMPLEPAP
jgi:DNA primase